MVLTISSGLCYYFLAFSLAGSIDINTRATALLNRDARVYSLLLCWVPQRLRKREKSAHTVIVGVWGQKMSIKCCNTEETNLINVRVFSPVLQFLVALGVYFSCFLFSVRCSTSCSTGVLDTVTHSHTHPVMLGPNLTRSLLIGLIWMKHATHIGSGWCATLVSPG